MYKLRRTPFVVLVALAACLFPVPATLLSMQGGTDGSFQSLSFLLLAMLAGPLLLPVVGGCLGVLLFQRERDWETLKNLYTVPVRWSGLVAAKLCVVYLSCILFSVISLLAVAATTTLTGTPVTPFGSCLAAAALTGFFYASITLPVILLVLWLDRGPLVSVLLCVLWGVAQSIQMFGGAVCDVRLRGRLSGNGFPLLADTLDLSRAGVPMVSRLRGDRAAGPAPKGGPLLSGYPAPAGPLSFADGRLRGAYGAVWPPSGGVTLWQR